MMFNSGGGEFLVEAGGGEIAAFCIDQGIRTMEPGDEFLAVSPNVTVTRVANGETETQPLDAVLGSPGWVRIFGTGRANGVFVVPTNAALGARFSIHVPTDKPAFLAPGYNSGLGWDLTRRGALKAIVAADRAYAKHAAILRQVADFGNKLRATYGSDSTVVKLFDSDTGAGPRPKINWRLRKATGADAMQVVREELANYRLDLLVRDGIDEAQAHQILRMPFAGETVKAVDGGFGAYVEAYRGFASPILATYFRQLVARSYVQSGNVEEATKSAASLIEKDPVCQVLSKKLASMDPGKARELEAKAIEALEFDGKFAEALRKVGVEAQTKEPS